MRDAVHVRQDVFAKSSLLRPEHRARSKARDVPLNLLTQFLHYRCGSDSGNVAGVLRVDPVDLLSHDPDRRVESYVGRRPVALFALVEFALDVICLRRVLKPGGVEIVRQDFLALAC